MSNQLFLQISNHLDSILDKNNLRFFCRSIKPTNFRSELIKRIQQCIDFIKPLLDLKPSFANDSSMSSFVLKINFGGKHKYVTYYINFMSGFVHDHSSLLTKVFEHDGHPVDFLKIKNLTCDLSYYMSKFVQSDKIMKTFEEELNYSEKSEWRSYCVNQLCLIGVKV